MELAEYAAVNNEEEPEFTEAEIKLLKREARKRKWVRRLRRLSDYVHATCKFTPLRVTSNCCSSLGHDIVRDHIQDKLLQTSLGKPKGQLDVFVSRDRVFFV